MFNSKKRVHCLHDTISDEEEEQIIDDDYVVEEDDDDVNEVQQNIRGRPRERGSNVLSFIEVIDSRDEDVIDDEVAYDSEEILQVYDNSSDEGQQRYLEFDRNTMLNDPSFEVGMQFGSFNDFKDAVRMWGIKNRIQLHFPWNDKRRCKATCMQAKEYECPFSIFASHVSKNDPTVAIKSINMIHKCPRVHQNFHVTSKWLAKKYYTTFLADRNWTANGLIHAVKEDTGIEISRLKAWRARNLALKWINGEEREQYQKLLSYKAEIEVTNPGSTVDLWLGPGGEFKGFYVCLEGLKRSWLEGVRKLICIDGTWLKIDFKGELLTAVSMDSNDQIFPIAWAVVVNENRENWTWFLNLLGNDLEIVNSHHITFMSDRQKFQLCMECSFSYAGLVNAVRDIFPNAEHRNCVRHMYVNFRGKFKGKELNDMIWNAARATILPDFTKWIEEIGKKNKEACEWLHHVDRPFNTWTRSLFRDDSMCDILLNNPCKVFNRYILDLRDKPIITMLEMIKNRISRRLHTRLELGLKWKGLICPKIQGKLEKIKVHAEMYYAKIESGPNVRAEGPGGPFIVNTTRRSCTCRRWDLTGIPCAHGIATLQAEHKNVEANCDNIYSVSNFRRVYSYVINPSRHKDLWPSIHNEMPVIPPPEKEKKKGRKTTARRKEAEELEIIAEENKKKKLSKAGGTITCSICGAITHNRRFHSDKGSSSQIVVEHEAPIISQTSQISRRSISQFSATNTPPRAKLTPRRRMFDQVEPSSG